MTVAAGVPAPRRATAFVPRARGPWLFGRGTDLAVFGGSAAASFALLAWGAATGGLEAPAPPWVWWTCILAVDVAHVWSTAFRVYLDGDEVRRRPGLYLGLPAALWVAGVALHALSALWFWRVVAYAAVFHFVRQQVGWVALYRRRTPGSSPIDRFVDEGATYAATVWPLLWWHAHLPRRFTWFVDGDFFLPVSPTLVATLEPLYWGLLAAFAARQVWRARVGLPVSAGKLLVVATTWACWWVGIVALDGDFAFTVTNVLIHGVPYLALTYRWGRARAVEAPTSAGARVLRGGLAAFLAFALAAAFVEEALWDRLVWHDRPWAFGVGPELSDLWLAWVVPALALPQLTHYALDGFVWRSRRDDRFRAALYA